MAIHIVRFGSVFILALLTLGAAVITFLWSVKEAQDNTEFMGSKPTNETCFGSCSGFPTVHRPYHSTCHYDGSAGSNSSHLTCAWPMWLTVFRSIALILVAGVCCFGSWTLFRGERDLVRKFAYGLIGTLVFFLIFFCLDCKGLADGAKMKDDNPFFSKITKFSTSHFLPMAFLDSAVIFFAAMEIVFVLLHTKHSSFSRVDRTAKEEGYRDLQHDLQHATAGVEEEYASDQYI